MKLPRPCTVAFLLALLAGTVVSLSPAADQQAHAQEAPAAPAAAAADAPRPATTVDELEAWVVELAGRLAEAAGAADAQIQGGNGVWQFVAFGRPMMVLSDPAAGRMRLLTPVLDERGLPVALDAAILDRLMRANFDSALDARYALRDGQLWSVYLHPLPTLTRADFESGVGQVLSLAHTFGTTFSSTGFRFGGGDAEPAPLEPAGEQTI